MKSIKKIPLDGLQGLKENISSDALSGFLVFLLALPLSLGIAKASDFPAIYGLVTAMIGGIFVSLIAGSKLTIKGPAAGLIVIVAGAVAELGNGNNELGWHLALGAIVVAGAVQVIFGLFKFGDLSDFFPLSAVHGMLAAIGIIIMSKQIHILAGVNPITESGKPMVEPIELLALLKETLTHFFKNKEVVIVGLISLTIVFAWPKIRIKAIKKIPAPLVVLAVSIPLSMYFNSHAIDETHKIPMVQFDKGLVDIIGINASFEGFNQFASFIKYVIMFALVGSLEALLTVKAIDMLDPYKRKSDYNKDLIAVGAGNIFAGLIGGLPMISEVARSSANVSNGGKTRWANFFHGLFILVFLFFAVSFSDLIPMTALAAMLIGVGYKLAHPKEFGHMAKIGWEQVVVFTTTIFVTLTTDLLIGIAAGIIVKLIIHLIHGAPMKNLFNSKSKIDGKRITVTGAAVFSNFIPIKKKINTFNYNEHITLDLRKCMLVDHTVIETLHHMKTDFNDAGGELEILGVDELEPVGKSKHTFAAKKRKK